ncbi:response regulator [Tichowtungia aerotolerans]|uniref:Response regulator n=1 Tax=Tichowtungia aerotolerans TaxID=2697043 RepID=A0A6P1M528_9BACT|nr:response regulator [Tichowtungia aerotolerans]QHI69690.1 response regulator [Tichowtungia aerotolerans]
MADILVVDDELDMIMMLKAALERQGHSVITASNGVEALGVLQERDVHLVVTDMHMPELDGFDLIPAVLEQFPGQRILAMSGVGQWEPKDNLNVARDLGAVCCVEKPFNLDDFYGCVEELVG